MLEINILIVDDDQDIQMLLEKYLNDLEEFSIFFTETAAETYDFLNFNNKQKETEIDLIILDIVLKKENGIEICKKIKAKKNYEDVPIIMITAHGNSKILKTAFAAGASDFIRKPINKIEFTARIKSAIKLRAEIKERLKREKELIQLSAKLKKVNKKLEKIALQDGLTGLANRRLFDQTIKKEIKRAKRNDYDLALIMADIDNFKAYNDTYGHQEGDECLKKVAVVLEENAKRASDLAARYGGEEFIIIMPDTDLKGASKVAEEIRKEILALKIEHKNSKTNDYLTLSFGVSRISNIKEINEQLIKEFIEAADNALYQAKENGRNQVAVKDFQ